MIIALLLIIFILKGFYFSIFAGNNKNDKTEYHRTLSDNYTLLGYAEPI